MPHFEAALRLKPGAAQPLNNLGLCLMNSGSYENAIPYFQQAERALPNSADIELNLGLSYSKISRQGLHDSMAQEAIKHYQAALRLRPDYAEAHDALGLLLVSRGRTEEGILQLEIGQRLHPDPAIANTLASLQSGQPR
jgi:tetratricopeptide (TPR) repeat protein